MAQDPEAAEKNHQRDTDILTGLLDETSARRSELGDSIAGEPPLFVPCTKCTTQQPKVKTQLRANMWSSIMQNGLPPACNINLLCGIQGGLGTASGKLASCTAIAAM